MDEFTFFLGAPEPCWLARADVSLMVSRRRTMRIANIAPARKPWVIDSSGYTELSLHGCWMLGDAEYVREVRRCRDDVGSLYAAAIKDWMCEPLVIGRTGKSIRYHQEQTVASAVALLCADDTLPWMPVLQGYTLSDYLTCYEMYTRAGIDLAAMRLVGVGTMCRRQSTREGLEILQGLAGLGLRLHGFGFKTEGLADASKILLSADSLAWSIDARRSLPLDGCEHTNCANCMRYALAWRERVLSVAGKLPAGRGVVPAPYRSPRTHKARG